jgi:hypothetical protein
MPLMMIKMFILGEWEIIMSLEILKTWRMNSLHFEFLISSIVETNHFILLWGPNMLSILFNKKNSKLMKKLMMKLKQNSKVDLSV